MEKGLKDGKDPISIERAALIVKRGWIPEQFKLKSSRPDEINSQELTKLTGHFYPGKNLHDYKIPNNPDNNEWHNMALEDFGMYWDLANYDEARYYYFSTLDLQGENRDECFANSPVMPDTVDEVAEHHY